MHIKTSGVVLKEQSINENDKLVTLLTLSNGVVRAFARGAKSPKNRKNAGTQLFCYCDFDLYFGNNVYCVEEALPRKSFFDLRNDIKALALAQYFCELMQELAPREENSDDYLKLILNSNYLLMTGKKEPQLLKPIFELRLLSLSGYMPSVVSCCKCGEYESDIMYFDTSKGELYCDKCNQNKYFAPLSISTVAAMRHVVFSEDKKIYSFSLSKKAALDFEETVERYLLSVTMRNYKTLDFYKML